MSNDDLNKADQIIENKSIETEGSVSEGESREPEDKRENKNLNEETLIGQTRINKHLLLMVQGALIAAVYVALTFVFAPLSFSQIQVRISEALTILPAFTAAGVPGLFIGCLLANLLAGAPIPDIIFGSLATLIGAVGTRMLRHRSMYFAPLPPIIANALIVPFVLKYAYGIPLPILLMMLTVGAGEVLSCGVLGLVLYKALERRRKVMFGGES